MATVISDRTHTDINREHKSLSYHRITAYIVAGTCGKCWDSSVYGNDVFLLEKPVSFGK